MLAHPRIHQAICLEPDVATLLYLLKWFATGHGESFPYDTAIFCLLLALDTNTLVRWWMFQRSGR